MNYKPIVGGGLLLLLSLVIVIAFENPNAPPPIPTEYWGQLIVNGQPAPDGTPVNYFNGEEWINTTTVGGWYNLILSGGDNPLTYSNDSDCSQHNAAGEACVPCTPGVDCTEGPKEGDTVNITVNNTPVQVKWGDNATNEESLIASIFLYPGWNMISLPILPITNNTPWSMLSTLTGRKVVYYYNTTTGSWNGYDSNTPPFTWLLKNMDPNRAYWVKVDTAQTFSFTGTRLLNNVVNLLAGWNMVGFQFYTNNVNNTMSMLTGRKVVYYYNTTSGTWKGYDSNTPPFTWLLKDIEVGRGYWVKVDSGQTWTE